MPQMRLQHVALSVTDIARSGVWYEKVLGLAKVAEFHEPAPMAVYMTPEGQAIDLRQDPAEMQDLGRDVGSENTRADMRDHHVIRTPLSREDDPGRCHHHRQPRAHARSLAEAPAEFPALPGCVVLVKTGRYSVAFIFEDFSMHQRVSSFVCVLASAVVFAGAITVRAQQPATAGQRYKDVQLLKDVSVEQFDTTMHYFGASLGWQCQNCHVRDQATGEFNYVAEHRFKTTAPMIT